VAYRDHASAQQARLEVLERELAEARQAAERYQRENQRLRRAVATYRVGRGLLMSAVGAVAGAVVTAVPAAASGNVRLLVPGALLGALFGMLVGLAREIDGS
jgi:hypothetical protein